jgi:hypothetical protein
MVESTIYGGWGAKYGGVGMVGGCIVYPEKKVHLSDTV